MNYVFEKLGVPSSDGIHILNTEIYAPKNEPRLVLQISHGMIDYVGRYEALADYLAERGIVVAGADHLGHGETVRDSKEYGYFAKKDGYKYVVDDLYAVNDMLHKRYEGLPVVMLGHSMGSFMARLYAVKYPDTISGIVIHGTGGKNPLLGAGKALVKILNLFYGEHHRSSLLRSMAFGSYNSKFPKEEGCNAWLTRDISRVSDRMENPKTSFDFSVSAYYDLFSALGECNKRSWYASYPKSLPTLIMSGTMDPVGNYGEGVRQVYGGLIEAGVEDLDIRMYEDARHELFNEINREECFSDLYEWLTGLL